MSDSILTHKQRNSNTTVDFDGSSVCGAGCYGVSPRASAPYLTITNKCTTFSASTPVNNDSDFEQIVAKIDEDFHYFERKNKYSRAFCERFKNDPLFRDKINTELQEQILNDSKNLYIDYQVNSVMNPDSLSQRFADGSIKCKYVNERLFSVYKPANLSGNSMTLNGLNDGHQSNSMNAAFQSANRLRELIQANPDFKYFLTLTFDKQKVASRSDAVELKRAISRFFQRLNIKYVLVPELHKDGSVHFHGVCDGSIEPYIVPFILHKDKMSRAMAQMIRDGRELYNFPKYFKRFGFCSIELIHNKQAVANYVSKYIVKGFLDPKNRLFSHRFFASKGLNRPSFVDGSTLSTHGLEPIFSRKITKFSLVEPRARGRNLSLNGADLSFIEGSPQFNATTQLACRQTGDFVPA